MISAIPSTKDPTEKKLKVIFVKLKKIDHRLWYGLGLGIHRPTEAGWNSLWLCYFAKPLFITSMYSRVKCEVYLNMLSRCFITPCIFLVQYRLLFFSFFPRSAFFYNWYSFWHSPLSIHILISLLITHVNNSCESTIIGVNDKLACFARH